MASPASKNFVDLVATEEAKVALVDLSPLRLRQLFKRERVLCFITA